MPRDLTFTDDDRCADDLMPPVQAPSVVWAQVRSVFASERVDRLPLRARLLDVLEHLGQGHRLALLGGAAPAVALAGHPDIALVAGVLFTYRYVEIAGRHRDNPQVIYFRLSEAGERKLDEGRRWWNGLSAWQRLRVRLFG